ncbi:hypothetical protein [Alicyclobacillus sendaiensis]|uniref:hypothetical protein n=1 Tax=Alicyclobacillus sendaiensis TaxID=192387 RepID=UPI000782634F|nr:hypothetical protein [Alicyclobacillus sendaiensis]
MGTPVTSDVVIVEARPLKMHKGLPTVIELTYVVGQQVRVLDYILRHPDQGKARPRKREVDKS